MTSPTTLGENNYRKSRHAVSAFVSSLDVQHSQGGGGWVGEGGVPVFRRARCSEAMEGLV